MSYPLKVIHANTYNKNMIKGCLTTKQASEEYGLSDAHIRRLLEYGKVRGEKVVRDWVMRPSAMDRYMGNWPKPGPKRRRRNAPRRTP